MHLSFIKPYVRQPAPSPDLPLQSALCRLATAPRKMSASIADPTQGDSAARRPASSVAEQSRAAGIGAENINDFLDRQSAAVLNRLYARPASCLAIFRLLPMLARQLVMQMLFLDAPLAWDDWNVQLTMEGRR